MPSSIILRTVATAAAGRPAAVLIARRAIAATPQLAHKESDHHTEADVTRHKEDLLHKHKQGKGHWKPELASDSEEAVKADRGAASNVDKDQTSDAVKRLQERTKHAAEQNSKAGTSMGDGL